MKEDRRKKDRGESKELPGNTPGEAVSSVLSRFGRCFVSDSYSYGLRRDLTFPAETPAAKIPIEVRPLQLGDIPTLRAATVQSERAVYDRFLEAGFSNGYVAVTHFGTPCFLQWLICPGENEKIQRLLGGLLPWLGPEEILLEQAFTLEPFRGLGIMSCAMSRIADLGREKGARWALAFAGEKNLAALKGCQRAGFRPYLIRRERCRFLRRRVSFHLIPRGTPFPFDAAKGAATDRLSLAG